MSDSSTNPDPLYQFVYVSKISFKGFFNPSTLDDIRDESRVFNPKHHLTGVLCYANFQFFQCIEGTKEDLLQLKGLLQQDPRHRDIKTLDFSPIEKRRFRFWVMQALVMEGWFMKDDRFGEVMPFKSVLWGERGWKAVLEHLAVLDAQTDASKFDAITIAKSELAEKIRVVWAEHQVFFMVQAFLALLVLISLIFLLKEVF